MTGRPRGEVGALRHLVLSVGLPLERTEDGDSPRPGLDPLEHAQRHAADVADAFRSFGYTPAEALGLSGGVPALVDSALANADVDVLVVHIVGHGELAGGGSDSCICSIVTANAYGPR